MSASKVILVADDNPEQLRFLLEVAEECLPGWELLRADAFDIAIQLIEKWPTLGAAVIDLHLSLPAVRREGLEVLKVIQRVNGDCYKILVSQWTQELAELGREDVRPDFFVYLKRDPHADLEAALKRAKEKFDFPDAQ